MNVSVLFFSGKKEQPTKIYVSQFAVYFIDEHGQCRNEQENSENSS